MTYSLLFLPIDFCLMPSDPGRCRAAFSMFYYDSKTMSCQQFIYGGCGGNANRFNSEEECMKTCPSQEGEGKLDLYCLHCVFPDE